MTYRISPLWWPILGLASPLIVPMLVKKNRKYKANCMIAEQLNRERFSRADLLNLPELDFLELTVLVEEKCIDGFIGDAGVSYLFRSNQGTLLYDVGFGADRPAFTHNASRFGYNFKKVDGLMISHLHPDHMGGIKASRTKSVSVPIKLGSNENIPCFLPDKATANGYKAEHVKSPKLLPGGLATTGPLARSLFFMGLTEEQAIVGRIKNKGLVIFTGCGHPTIEVILEMVSRLSDEPVYAIGGGLHFPITKGRGNRLGIQFQMIIGTGYPPWRRLNTDDLDRTIQAVNGVAPQQVFLSAHDTCDWSLERMQNKLTAETRVLKAGESYRF
ncbi:MBL fold metallo-hydrolase [bacterium]|nr:MBL fold metallo-hydrolase [bacterium]